MYVRATYTKKVRRATYIEKELCRPTNVLFHGRDRGLDMLALRTRVRTCEVRFRRCCSARSINLVWPGGKSVLGVEGMSEASAAHAAGHEVRFGCREGRCGTCEHIATLEPGGERYLSRPCVTSVPGDTLLGDSTTIVYEAVLREKKARRRRGPSQSNGWRADLSSGS